MSAETTTHQTTPTPKPVEGHARVRRLGAFGPPDPAGGLVRPEQGSEAPDTRQGRKRAADAPLPVQRAIVAVVLLALGVLVTGVGVGIALGLGWGLTTLGLLTLALGIMIART